jgi:signal transduction histidine kinase
MTRRASLTLSTVLMVGVVTAVLSAFYLANQIEKQFQFVLVRARSMTRVASDNVVRSVEQHPNLPFLEAIRTDTDLADRLLKIMTISESLLEIAICDPQGRVVLSTDSVRQPGTRFPDYPNYERLVQSADSIAKIRVLTAEGQPQFYQMIQALEAEGHGPLLTIHVVIYPALLRQDIMPDLRAADIFSGLAILGCVVGALIFSSYAFRPLTQVSQLLDNLTRGEYIPAPAPEGRPRKGSDRDEFGAVFSKVNLLGQQLGEVNRFLDQLEEALLVFGRDRTVILASGSLEKFLGKRRSNVIGRTLASVFPDNSPIVPLLEQVAETGKPIRDLKVRISPDDPAGGQPHFALLSVDFIESPDTLTRRPAGLLVRLRDPDVRRQLQDQLQLADRITAINRVTTGVAHEVKNPLNAMLMHLEIAKMKLARGDSAIDQQIEVISSEITRLDRVVKTFLDFTRPVDLKMKETPVDSFVESLVELTRPQASAAGVTVETAFQAKDAIITADIDLLKQALLNLVVNAIEAMPEGGSLRMETEMKGPVNGSGQEVEIRIADTGIGIPENLREKIFKLYFTTKRRGSGIGLALTFRMVQLHGGKIDFVSEPGSGTTFNVRFPLAGTSR